MGNLLKALAFQREKEHTQYSSWGFLVPESQWSLGLKIKNFCSGTNKGKKKVRYNTSILEMWAKGKKKKKEPVTEAGLTDGKRIKL